MLLLSGKTFFLCVFNPKVYRTAFVPNISKYYNHMKMPYIAFIRAFQRILGIRVLVIRVK